LPARDDRRNAGPLYLLRAPLGVSGPQNWPTVVHADTCRLVRLRGMRTLGRCLAADSNAATARIDADSGTTRQWPQEPAAAQKDQGGHVDVVRSQLPRCPRGGHWLHPSPLSSRGSCGLSSLPCVVQVRLRLLTRSPTECPAMSHGVTMGIGYGSKRTGDSERDCGLDRGSGQASASRSTALMTAWD
jgi:hypothetical protein